MTAHEFFLTTARLGFRSWRSGDLALARALWGDPEVTRLFDARPQWTEEQVHARLEREMECERLHGVQYWPIFRLDDGEHVGVCGLHPKDAATRVLELGFHLRPAFWGAGYASEAATAVIAHAFAVCGARALFAGHHPENNASRRALERLGFRFTHEELYAPTGALHRCYLLTPQPKHA
jgi:RimJ/RimL family protein N-acetyltransferase